MMNNQIPKVIHYCWFGGKPLPSDAKKCIESWRRFLPDYEIKEWNEDNYNVRKNTYMSQAYDAKKYAFVSDYARFDILNQCGGVYFDTDVEVIKSMDVILSKGPYMGFETPGAVAAGLGMSCSAKMPIVEEILNSYVNETFINEDGSYNEKTIVARVTEFMSKHGLSNENVIQNVAGFTIYPVEYFCPISTFDAKLRITEQTYSIHHYAQSWVSPAHRIMRNLILKIGGGALKRFILMLRK